MMVKVFRGISKDFAELTKSRGSNGKKLQIILVLIFEFFLLLYHSLIILVLKVVDLDPFNDTWRKKRSVPN
jgi:hypothetical protein